VSQPFDPEKLYRGAIVNARLQSKRNLRAWNQGQRDTTGPSLMELERRTIIRQIQRAYEIGLAEGLAKRPKLVLGRGAAE
jgi:hypothetical protein